MSTKAKFKLFRFISEDDHEPDAFLLFRLEPGKDDILGAELVRTFWSRDDAIAERDRLAEEVA